MDRTLVVVFDNEDAARKDHAFHVRPQETEDAGGDISRVLLLRNDPAESSALVDRLLELGCACRVASFQEGVALLGKQHFHVVLSEFRVSESNTHRLISQLTGSAASLFFRLEVEDGCWWLPAVVSGQDCWGAPAIRPKDVHPVLRALLRQMVSGAHQISSQDSAVLTQLFPEACAVRPVDDEAAPANPRGLTHSAAHRNENMFETAVNAR